MLDIEKITDRSSTPCQTSDHSSSTLFCPYTQDILTEKLGRSLLTCNISTSSRNLHLYYVQHCPVRQPEAVHTDSSSRTATDQQLQHQRQPISGTIIKSNTRLTRTLICLCVFFDNLCLAFLSPSACSRVSPLFRRLVLSLSCLLLSTAKPTLLRHASILCSPNRARRVQRHRMTVFACDYGASNSQTRIRRAWKPSFLHTPSA